MITLQRSRSVRIGTMLLAAGLALTACVSDSAPSEGGSDKAVVLKAADLQPDGIVGKGQHGETPENTDVLQLTDAEKEKVRAGGFRVGIVMQTATLDWASLQVQGMTDTLKNLGVEVIGQRVVTRVGGPGGLLLERGDVFVSAFELGTMADHPRREVAERNRRYLGDIVHIFVPLIGECGHLERD